ncbi:MAG: hypothetical protein R2854_01355 [Caldilineaceae bacterium]
MIPEYVPVTTSLTTRRTSKWNSPVGTFIFHHTKPERFYGFGLHELGNSQSALVALPEKALLDLIHLQPQGDNPDYLDELRLQNLDQLDLNLLGQFAHVKPAQNFGALWHTLHNWQVAKRRL